MFEFTGENLTFFVVCLQPSSPAQPEYFCVNANFSGKLSPSPALLLSHRMEGERDQSGWSCELSWQQVDFLLRPHNEIWWKARTAAQAPPPPPASPRRGRAPPRPPPPPRALLPGRIAAVEKFRFSSQTSESSSSQGLCTWMRITYKTSDLKAFQWGSDW